ncbi:MAG TPA: hypothetical protein PKD70_11195 [Saprospiraceae bacterium]|nr:hypothetical protein [Saprospiraceae bacterium]HMP14437.1 hypothetical protein [Saprospiraceae bacterium]
MQLNEQIRLVEMTINDNSDADLLELLNGILESLKRLESLDNEARKKEGKVPDYKSFVDVYFDFHISAAGVKPMMNGQQGKALKEIIIYLGDNVKSAEFTALDAWTWILSHWKQLTPFLQNQITLSSIKKNLPEILMQLRNGATTQQKAKAATATAKASIIRRRTRANHKGD